MKKIANVITKKLALALFSDSSCLKTIKLIIVDNFMFKNNTLKNKAQNKHIKYPIFFMN